MFGYPLFLHILIKKILSVKDKASVLFDKENSVKRSIVSMIFLFIIFAVCIFAMFYDAEPEHGNKDLGWFGALATSVENFPIVNSNHQVKKGALITSITPNSPARKSGLMAGDIIVYLDNKKIRNAGSLKREIIDKKPNDRFNITVIRNRQWEIFSVRYKT